MSKRKRSRAHYLGVAPAKLQRQLFALEKILSKRCLAIAYAWGDVDNSVVGAVDQFLDRFKELQTTIDDAVKRLREPEDAPESDSAG